MFLDTKGKSEPEFNNLLRLLYR